MLINLLISLLIIFENRLIFKTLQQGNYKSKSIFTKKIIYNILKILLFQIAFYIGLDYILLDITKWHNIFALIPVFLIGMSNGLNISKERQKVKITKRLARILLVNFGLCILFLELIDNFKMINIYVLAPNICSSVLEPIFLVITMVLLKPIEKLINGCYKRKARNTLKVNPNAIIIGITGSFAKTSVKNILKAFLSSKYSVFATPKSYNTEMGIVKSLEKYSGEDIVILEMGARHRHDIEKCCSISKLDIGIITAVSNQHLSEFKNQEKIFLTKYELVQNLKPNGKMYFGDNFGARKLELKAKFQKINIDDTKVKISNSINTKNGLEFTLTYRNEKIDIKTKLLGYHNAKNIALATRVALNLGIEFNDILKLANKLLPSKHRLELIKANGLNIIDDSYNSNVHGAKSALEVLESFDENKIVITSGLVELGKLEHEENKLLGREIADVANLVILIGKNRCKPIIEGLREASFSQDKVIISEDFTSATNELKANVRLGDTVLFLNDLADIYFK